MPHRIMPHRIMPHSIALLERPIARWRAQRDDLSMIVRRGVARTALALSAAVLLAAVTSCASHDEEPATGTSSDSANVAPAAALGDGVHLLTTSEGIEVTYVLVVPPGRPAGVPGKVLLAFPPGGQDLELTERVVDDRWRDEAVARDWVVVSPAAPSSGLWYEAETTALVGELLDAVASSYPPVDGRFDLAGVSNGGLSAFAAALATPQRFRSLVTFPGNSPQGGDDPQLSELAGIGVALFVGADDEPWRRASEATKAHLDEVGVVAELHVVAGQGHRIETLTGSELFDAIERVAGGAA